MSGFNMMLSDAATALGATVQGENRPLQGVSTDTRQIQPGNLFIALKGPNFDGHDYLRQAMDKGAAACLVSRQTDVPAIRVADTRLALGQLAQAWRQQHRLPLLAVTGSNGKTTVKEMIAAIFSQHARVLATRGNLNNDIGLPLTLLRLDEHDAYAVVELGANHAGEIASLTDIARPDVAIITNAGAAHLEGFGSVEGVARAKGELFAGLSDEGVAIINADDTYAPLWRELAGEHRIVTFGLQQAADIRARWQDEAGGSHLQVQMPDAELALHLPLPGEHNVMNALAAIAATRACGIDAGTIRAGLQGMRSVPGRLQIKAGLGGSRIIDDTYNANPSSLSAALKVLRGFPGRHFLALGDMGELGPDAEMQHAVAGKQARQQGVERLYAVGPMAAAASRAFGASGWHFDAHQAAIDMLRQDLQDDVTLLVKGSRLSHMERLVEALSARTEV